MPGCHKCKNPNSCIECKEGFRNTDSGCKGILLRNALACSNGCKKCKSYHKCENCKDEYGIIKFFGNRYCASIVLLI